MERWTNPAPPVIPVELFLLKARWYAIHEERTRMWSFVTQIFLKGLSSQLLNRRSYAFNFTTRKHWFSRFLVSSELYNWNHDRHRTLSSGISYQLRHVYITSWGIFSRLKFPHVSYISRWLSQPIFNLI